MKKPATRQLSPPTMEEFSRFVKEIISVPKAEIDRREAEYKRRRRQAKTSTR